MKYLRQSFYIPEERKETFMLLKDKRLYNEFLYYALDRLLPEFLRLKGL